MTNSIAQKLAIESAHREVLSAIRRVNKSKNLNELVDHVEQLAELAKKCSINGTPTLLAKESTALDLQFMSTALRPISDAMPIGRTLFESELIASLRLPNDCTLLAIYYLRQLGLVSRSGRGSKAALTLLSRDIHAGRIQSVWPSIQPTAPADADFMSRHA